MKGRSWFAVSYSWQDEYERKYKLYLGAGEMSQRLRALPSLSEVLSSIAKNHTVTHKFYLCQGAISGVQIWSPCEELENKNGESGRSDRGYPSCLTFNTEEEKFYN